MVFFHLGTESFKRYLWVAVVGATRRPRREGPTKWEPRIQCHARTRSSDLEFKFIPVILPVLLPIHMFY